MTGDGSALHLVLTGDPALFAIVELSLIVSLSAVLLSALIGVPVGAFIALTRFPGREGVIVILNALMGLPPVVVGLAVYLLLSRSGPLGELGILFTPQAMVIAQTVLVTPIIAALSRQTIEDLWVEYRDELAAMNVGPFGRVVTLIWDARFSLVTALLAGFGRAAAEVGAILIVGGNIDGFTRTMTTAIALETSKGDLPLAIGLGIVLISIVVVDQRARLGRASRRRNLRGMTMRPPAFDLPIMFVDVGIVAGGVTILDRITLTLSSGAPTVLIGPNGSGKTTLLRAAMGLLPVSRGFITWGGRENFAADAARHFVPASGHAPAQRRRQYPLRARRCRTAARGARKPHRRIARRCRAGKSRAPAGAPPLRRRAAATGAGTRLGARPGGAVSRRADRQSRSRRHQGDRGHRARRHRARRQGGDVDPRSRPGQAAGR